MFSWRPWLEHSTDLPQRTNSSQWVLSSSPRKQRPWVSAQAPSRPSMAPQVCTERAGDDPWGHNVTMKPGHGEAPARAAARRPAGPLDFKSSCNGPGEGAGVPCDLRQQGPVGTGSQASCALLQYSLTLLIQGLWRASNMESIRAPRSDSSKERLFSFSGFHVLGLLSSPIR